MADHRHVRPYAAQLEGRLAGPRRLIQVLAGPRQVGKSTLVAQVVARLSVPVHSVSADDAASMNTAWLDQQWEVARLLARDGRHGAWLVVDEVQKIPRWSDAVKARWDEDTRAGHKVRVLLLGSSPLLMDQGLAESLAGRFELLRMSQWPPYEMESAFGGGLDHHLFFGGYPGAAHLVRDERRWRAYVRDALIETTIARDVLQLTRVEKPALLRRMFELGCTYSGQELSYTKILGQLQDAGNTTTLSHYAELLDAVGMLTALQKYAGQRIRQRASAPKWMVHDTALMTAQLGVSRAEARRDPSLWGRIVESAVGAHLLHGAREEGFQVFYWRDSNREVDFVVERAGRVTAIEVKSGKTRTALVGMEAFVSAFKPARTLMIGGGGLTLDRFLSRPASEVLA